jgi:hypothetical protein
VSRTLHPFHIGVINAHEILTGLWEIGIDGRIVMKCHLNRLQVWHYSVCRTCKNIHLPKSLVLILAVVSAFLKFSYSWHLHQCFSVLIYVLAVMLVTRVVKHQSTRCCFCGNVDFRINKPEVLVINIFVLMCCTNWRQECREGLSLVAALKNHWEGDGPWL